jgi:hypothetical protein
MAAFWDVATSSLVEVYQFYRGVYFLHHQSTGGSKQLFIVSKLLPEFATSQKKTILIFATVAARNPTMI